ncbi:MAG: MFS transporter [Bartonella sp.]|nr:MFS transporter [Bartonella sp.]
MHSEDMKIVKVEDTSLTAFYRDMNIDEKRTFWACAAGWALDGLDVMIYPLVIGTIIAMWHIAEGTAGMAVTITLLTSAVGGWLAGFFADRIGRVITLQVTIIWFSVFSLLCAFAQNFEQLMIFRALLGLGFGGEWAAGAVLLGETIRAQYRGRAVGCVQAGYAIGWGGAVLAQAILFTVVDPEIAWRYMFVVGAFPALLIFYIRRHVKEPEIAKKTRMEAKKTGHSPKIWEIFKGDILSTTIFASIASAGCQGGYYAITTWVPRYLTTERGLSILSSTGYLFTLIVGSFVGYLVGAWMSDRFGRRMLFLVFSLGAIVVVLVYTLIPFSNTMLWFLGFPLGFFSSGYFSGMGAFLTELFPTRLRGSGQGFCYNFGRGLGALFPTFVGYLSSQVGLGNAVAIFAAGAYSLFFLAAFMLPETRGRVLQD